MAIRFHQTSKEFHLYNEKISYIIKILENGQLGHVYYGKRITDREDFGYLVEYVSRIWLRIHLRAGAIFLWNI